MASTAAFSPSVVLGDTRGAMAREVAPNTMAGSGAMSGASRLSDPTLVSSLSSPLQLPMTAGTLIVRTLSDDREPQVADSRSDSERRREPGTHRLMSILDRRCV